MSDLSDQVIELLSESILLSVPRECMEGVKKNACILHQYSQIIHKFKIPEIEIKG